MWLGNISVTGLGGPSFEHALMLTKAFDNDPAQRPESAESTLTLAQASKVLFRCAFGAGVAFQG